jgi:predicted DNA-binding protein (UPF0251 family)
MNQPARPLPELAPELSLYRNHTIALLRRYFCVSVEVGRLPALLGRECFRTNEQDYHVHSFENMVIFVIDIERCLDRLDPFDKKLIALIVLQEYTQEEAAQLLGCTDRQVRNRFVDAIDTVSAMFLEKRMLKPKRRRRRAPQPVDELPPTVTIASCADPRPPVPVGLLAYAQLVPASAELA